MSTSEAKNGPRKLNPKLHRNDYFNGCDYTINIANAVDIHLTEQQTRDLYQQLHEEFRPKAYIVSK